MPRALPIALVVLALLFALVRWIERRMLFVPSAEWAFGLDGLEGARELSFEAADGVRLSGLWLPLAGAKGVVVHCHGNAGNVSHRFAMAERWRQSFGVSVLLFDYRGYGKSEGRPSEAGLLLDARAAFREARALAGEAAPLWISGRSLGTVPATLLAAEREVRGLLLDSPMASARAMSRSVLGFALPGFLLGASLDNAVQIQRVRCPILVVHGRGDRVVPIEHGREVFAAASEPKRFVELATGHNDVRDGHEYVEAMHAFFEPALRQRARNK